MKPRRKRGNIWHYYVYKWNDNNTFLTIVSFGFKTASPPGGSLGAPVTN